MSGKSMGGKQASTALLNTTGGGGSHAPASAGPTRRLGGGEGVMTRVAMPCRRASFRLREPRAFFCCGGGLPGCLGAGWTGEAFQSRSRARLISAVPIAERIRDHLAGILRHFRFQGSSSAARQAHGYALAAACCILQWPRSADLRYRIPRINFAKTAFRSLRQNQPRC